MRGIVSAGYRDHTDPIFSELKLLRLNEIHQLELLIFVHRQMQTPTVTSFDFASNIHNLNLRNENLLRFPQPRSEAVRRLLCIEAAKNGIIYHKI